MATNNWNDLRVRTAPEWNLRTAQTMIQAIRMERQKQALNAIKAKQAALATTIERRQQSGSVLELNGFGLWQTRADPEPQTK
jgi:hypothetical protein